MKTICISLATAALVLIAARGGAQDKTKPAWREWGILAPEEDATIHALAFSPKTLTVAAGQSNGKVRLWNAVTGLEEKLLEATEFRTILALHFDETGKRLYVAGETGVIGWDLASGKRVVEHAWYKAPCTAATFRRDGGLVAFATADNAVDVWALPAGKLTTQLAFAKSPWLVLAFDGEGEQLATGGSDGSLLLWNLRDKKLLATLEQPGAALVRAVAFSPNGKLLASVRGREVVAVWTLKEKPQRAKLSGGTAPYTALAFGPDNATVAAGSASGAVQWWSVTTGTELAVHKGHSGLVFTAAFAGDGTMLATASNDGTLRIWDSLPGRKLPELKLEKAHFEALFKDLRSDSDLKASLATLVLSSSPAQALPALRAVLRQGKTPDHKLLKKLFKDLESDEFQVRHKATLAITAMGQSARADLRKLVTEKPPNLETEMRAKLLLEKLENDKLTAGDQLLTRRAIVILERMGNDEARAILEGLVYGVPDDVLMKEAQDALARLKK
jgi:hypothetical protein